MLKKNGSIVATSMGMDELRDDIRLVILKALVQFPDPADRLLDTLVEVWEEVHDDMIKKVRGNLRLVYSRDLETDNPA